jgi:predicted ArsR family transcriptional regulator
VLNGTSVTADFYFARPTPVQARVLELVERYYGMLKSPCPSTYVASQLGKHHETVREHFAALHRKGWLKAENSPATPTREFLARRD